MVSPGSGGVLSCDASGVGRSDPLCVTGRGSVERFCCWGNPATAVVVVEGNAVTGTVVVVGDEVEAGTVVVGLADRVPLPENPATAANKPRTAPMTNNDRPRNEPDVMATSVPSVGAVPLEISSRSGASTGFPHELQNAPVPASCPHEKHERRRLTP